MDAELLDKLNKILRLTASPNENEAAAAAGHLHRLLAKYNLDIADLEKRGAAERPGVRQEGHDLGKAAFTWKLDLAEGLATHYWCHPLVDRNRKTVAFIGRPDNVQSLQMLYGWIIDQIRRIARDERRAHYDRTGDHIDPLRWQVNFGVGCVERLVERLTELRAREEEDAVFEAAAGGGSTALAVLSTERNREISDYLESIGEPRIDGRETQKERQYRERREAEDARLAELKSRDLEAYYRECPWDRPRTEAEIAAAKARDDKWMKDYLKREKKNRRRRENYIPTGTRREARVDEAKEEQSDTARRSGQKAAAKVNLRPFLQQGKSKGDLKG